MSMTPPRPTVFSFYTYGDWFEDEDSAAAAFDAAAEATGLFQVHREVDCVYVNPRRTVVREAQRKSHSKRTGIGRIDRVLLPNRALLDAGWRYGAIGVEIKCSGHEVGPIVCQVLDYQRGLFELGNGTSICLDQIFIWPLHFPRGCIGSVMAQNRIGAAWSDPPRKVLALEIGGTQVISCGLDGEVRVKPIVCGNKEGSR